VHVAEEVAARKLEEVATGHNTQVVEEAAPIAAE
jgi:hypothetical protein